MVAKIEVSSEADRWGVTTVGEGGENEIDGVI
mgnify:CR=1 FL=1